jgi:DNA-binding transcriptional regulator YiaG
MSGSIKGGSSLVYPSRAKVKKSLLPKSTKAVVAPWVAKAKKLVGNSTRKAVFQPLQARKVTVAEVRGKLGVSQPEMSRMTGYSIRSIAAWEGGKPLSDAARQKLQETERLRVALSEIIPEKELHEWLRAPNPAFEGQTPIQIIERGESDRIWQMIFEIDAGVAS